MGLGLGQTNPTVQATNPEIIEERNNKEMTAQAQIYMKKNTEARIQHMVSNMDQSKIEVAVEMETILINTSDPSKKIKRGSGLEANFRNDLVSLLQGYSDIFAWTPKDMPGLDESIAMHSLDVNPERKPVKQKRRNFAPERQKAIDEEIEKLLKAGIICEVKYPE